MSSSADRQLKHFQSQLRIDRETLDEELANFPGLYYTISDHYLEASKRKKRLEERLERKFAEIASAIRHAAHDTNTKMTEAAIKQEVLIHPKYRKLRARLQDAVYIRDRWAILKDAHLQKSFSLKSLVGLKISERHQRDSTNQK